MPRFSLVAFSFSQLSMTMKAPAMVKPVKARSRIQTIFVDDQAGQQRDDRARRGERAEGPDMAGAAHQARRKEAAGDEAARPGRAHQAERGGRKPFELAAQRQQQAVQARRREQESGAAQQREDRSVGCEHASCIRLFESGWTAPV